MGLDDRQINALLFGGGILLFLFLAAMTLWHAYRARSKPARPVGDGWVLSPSRGHFYAAAFFGLFVLMGIALISDGLGRSSGWMNSGTIMGLVLTAIFAAMTIWMVRLYTGWRVYFDDKGIAVRRYGLAARRFTWDQLTTGTLDHRTMTFHMTTTGQPFFTRSPQQMVLKFGAETVRVPSTLQGYRDFIAFMDSRGLGQGPRG